MQLIMAVFITLQKRRLYASSLHAPLPFNIYVSFFQTLFGFSEKMCNFAPALRVIASAGANPCRLCSRGSGAFG